MVQIKKRMAKVYGAIEYFDKLYFLTFGASLVLSSLLIYWLSFFEEKSFVIANTFLVIVGVSFALSLLIHVLYANFAPDREERYYLQKCVEILGLVLASSIFSNQVLYDILLVLPLFATFYLKGLKSGLILLTYTLIAKVTSVYVIHKFIGGSSQYIGATSIIHYAEGAVLYLAIIALCVMGARFYERFTQTENSLKSIKKQFNESFEELSLAKAETRMNIEKAQEATLKMEEMHMKLRGSRAEMYTIQQIIEAVGAVFDISELLRQVNDVIIGVMGVTNSIVIFYDEVRNELKLNTTNISNPNELEVIKQNINCPILFEVLNSRKGIVENSVDEEKYPFVKGRGIQAVICVPLFRKDKKIGLIVIEHIMSDLFYDENKKFMEVIGQQVSLAIENSELYNKMQEMASIDGLTGVYNRMFFQHKFPEEVKKARENNYELSLAMFDIDHFKRFNDTYGHIFGDEVLKRITAIVKNSLKQNEMVARYGGEEFVILLPRVGLNDAYDRIERIRKEIADKPIEDDGEEIFVTVSFGIDAYPSCSKDSEELLRNADDALYIAKSSGRNCVKTVNQCKID